MRVRAGLIRSHFASGTARADPEAVARSRCKPAAGALGPPGKAGKTGKPAWCRPGSRWGTLPFECGQPPLAAHTFERRPAARVTAYRNRPGDGGPEGPAAAAPGSTGPGDAGRRRASRKHGARKPCQVLQRPTPRTPTAPSTCRSSRAWTRSASAQACTSARPTAAACSTASGRSSTTRWTRPWAASAPASTSSCTPTAPPRSGTTAAASRWTTSGRPSSPASSSS